MDNNWATEHLQTIRMLMERSAIYRRALAPIMIFAGTLGVAAGAAGLLCRLDSMRAFGALWLGTAAVAVVGAFLIARQQALKNKEVFWSPPTRRVGEALLPPLTAGMCLGLVFVLAGVVNEITLTFVWLLFYGCALHAAGFFMPRGVKFFGWIFIGLACVGLCFLALAKPESALAEHWFIAYGFMGFFFGILHLTYGIYLYLTEKRKNAA